MSGIYLKRERFKIFTAIFHNLLLVSKAVSISCAVSIEKYTGQPFFDLLFNLRLQTSELIVVWQTCDR